ncbi:unnamed protein product [Moneuplotes crassus]|uniref:Uncharacterized protein n=1 Tax=Euplotes crassus TaxID=5936 RepID=A0AAD1UQN9_EUPCR|nr:unnamed protein product [Moneuplotes crassus]
MSRIHRCKICFQIIDKSCGYCHSHSESVLIQREPDSDCCQIWQIETNSLETSERLEKMEGETRIRKIETSLLKYEESFDKILLANAFSRINMRYPYQSRDL